MSKLVFTAILMFTGVSAFADCAPVAIEAASLIAKLPRNETGRGFVLEEGREIISRDIGTDTYRISLQLNGERLVYDVSLNRRTCQVASVVRKFQP